jgi:glutamate/tyrosine decarboxylase-like PLP-dependent enzyme
MDLEALDATLAAFRNDGLQLLALVATAGTTDLGAIDPLDELAERALRAGAWFHVDAAVAGAFLLSDTLRPRLRGLERADSITIDFHKLWWQPFNASALVVRDVERFDLLRVKSNYLDRGDELEGLVNLVGRSLDTSRRSERLVHGPSATCWSTSLDSRRTLVRSSSLIPPSNSLRYRLLSCVSFA